MSDSWIAGPKPYHHGDLRRALVDAARELVRESGAQALALREVARRSGVSRTAPYRHFADRRELVAAVAAEGFRELHSRIVAGVAGAAGGKRALQVVAEEYVAFAMEHPAEYRLMFGEEMAQDPAIPEFTEASRSVFDLLRGGIGGLAASGALAPRPVDEIAIACWAMVHGLVMLTLDRQVPAEYRGRSAELVAAATGILMNGMVARPPRRPE